MDGVWKLIGVIAEENSGIITTAQVEAAGISRAALKRYVDEKQLIRVCKGCMCWKKG
ncbi:MAG: type IV toxin-antitoxin system AbiEi family antitoxin domain-containing protein [Enterocloster clostridioformis]